jgi:hypothetical protein
MTQKPEGKTIKRVGDKEFEEIALRALKEDKQLLKRLAKV